MANDSHIGIRIFPKIELGQVFMPKKLHCKFHYNRTKIAGTRLATRFGGRRKKNEKNKKRKKKPGSNHKGISSPKCLIIFEG